jgi:predicted DCC family thiol-disulfide oxidoreductase YuxK
MSATLLFDGDCGFCTSSVTWLRRVAPSPARVVPWQRADLPELDVTAEECADAVMWRSGDARLSGPDAFAAYLGTSTAVWRLVGRMLGMPPARWVSWPVYRWASRHRHQLPGGTPACKL